jgi:hypothetical protein
MPICNKGLSRGDRNTPGVRPVNASREAPGREAVDGNKGRTRCRRTRFRRVTLQGTAAWPRIENENDDEDDGVKIVGTLKID